MFEAKKYEFIPGEKKYVDLINQTGTSHLRIQLNRIRALRSFGDVKSGDIGGWIQWEANLSHEGMCWVYDDACVLGKARVIGDAKVCGQSYVSDNARIDRHALILDHARVGGCSIVSHHAVVKEYAEVRAGIVSGHAVVEGHGCIYGRRVVISGEARIGGNADIVDAKIFGDAWVGGDAIIHSSLNRPSIISTGTIMSGCITDARIARSNDYAYFADPEIELLIYRDRNGGLVGNFHGVKRYSSSDIANVKMVLSVLYPKYSIMFNTLIAYCAGGIE